MVLYSDNRLDPKLDVIGTLDHESNLNVSDESLGYGSPIQSGSGAIIFGSNISGLINITIDSVGNYIQLSGLNVGIYRIDSVVSSSQIKVQETLTADINVNWVERNPYSLQDDINYARSDRAAIKGVSYDSPIPTYHKCTDQSTSIPANLYNIAGKTTDAKSFVVDKKFENAVPIAGSNFITLTATNAFRHSDSVNTTGVPISDGFDIGNEEATYAEIIGDGYQKGISVLSGIYAGNRIFGRMRKGFSISPNSVEVEWRSVQSDHNITESVSYIWEVEQVKIADIYYPYRECLYNISDTAFRTSLVNGLVGKSNSTNLPKAQTVGQVLFSIDGDSFVQALPITGDGSGWLINEEGLMLVDVSE